MRWFPGPLGRLFAVSALGTLANFALNAGLFHESRLADLALYFGMFFCVFAWLSADSRRFRHRPSHGYALWVVVAAPVLIPHFVLRTRGRSGIWLALGLEIALFAPIVGAYLDELAYPHVPEMFWLPGESFDGLHSSP